MGTNQKSVAGDRESVLERLLAAAVLVPLVEVTLLMGFLARWGKRGPHVFFNLPSWLFGTYALLGAVAGFALGWRGLAWLFGHVLGTHLAKNRSAKTSGLLWPLLLALSSVGFVFAANV